MAEQDEVEKALRQVLSEYKDSEYLSQKKIEVEVTEKVDKMIGQKTHQTQNRLQDILYNRILNRIFELNEARAEKLKSESPKK